MIEYPSVLHERFFTWCDNAVQDHIDHERTPLNLKQRPRKNPDGSYDLVLKTAVRDEAAAKVAVPIPEEFHELLEREYFCNHSPDEDEES